MFCAKLRPVWQRFAPETRAVWAPKLAKPNPTFAGQTRGYPGYNKFGHKREVEPLITKITLVIFGTLMVATVLDWRWIRMIFLYYTGELEEKKDNPVASQSK